MPQLHRNAQFFCLIATAKVTYRAQWQPSGFLITPATVWPVRSLEEGWYSVALAYGLIDELAAAIWRWWRYTSSHIWILAIKQVSAVIKVAVSFQALRRPLIMAHDSTVIKLLVVRNKDKWFRHKLTSTGRKATTAIKLLYCFPLYLPKIHH